MRALREHRVLIAGVVVLLAVRLAISLTRSGPVIMADEAGYLMNARVLAGGLAAEMGPSPFYRGGYSLVISPLLALGAGPVATYHWVLAANALLAALLAPILYALARVCLGATTVVATWAALAGAAYPSVTALSQVALAENLLFPLTAAWLLAAGLLLRTPSAPWMAVVTGAAAGALWTAHGRMFVIAALTVVLLASLARAQRRVAAAGLAALATVVLAGRALNAWLVTHSYAGRRFDELDRVRDSLDGTGALGAVARNLAGHTWYLVVATLGLALVVAARGVVPAAVALGRRRRLDAEAGLLALLGAATVALLAVSALWFVTLERADQLVYGRYAESVAPVIVAAGLVLLARAPVPSPGRVAAWIAALTAAVVVLRAGIEVGVDPSRWNAASLPSVTGNLDGPVLAVAGAVAVAALLALAAVRARAAAPGMLALVLCVPTTAYLVNLPVLRSERDVYPGGWTTPEIPVRERGAAAVGYDTAHYDHVAVKVYQWFLPATRVIPFDARRAPAPAALVFSGAAAPPEAGARRVWRDPGRDQAMWERP